MAQSLLNTVYLLYNLFHKPYESCIVFKFYGKASRQSLCNKGDSQQVVELDECPGHLFQPLLLTSVPHTGWGETGILYFTRIGFIISPKFSLIFLIKR